jgi:Mg-chelatase subunit ChlI
MFPMTPEDLYRQVARSQDEARQQVARERMAMAAARASGTKWSALSLAASSAFLTISHNARLTTRRLFRALAAPAGVARHRAR